MKQDKYLKPQHTIKAGIGANGMKAEAWWYGQDDGLHVYIDRRDGTGCHWAQIPRRSIEAWLRATGSAGGSKK